MSGPSFYRVRSPFSTATRVYNPGQVIAVGDPVLTKGRLQFLEPLGVEQATAAPGERRMVRLPGREKKAEVEAPAEAPVEEAQPAAGTEPEAPKGLTTKSLPRVKKGK